MSEEMVRDTAFRMFLISYVFYDNVANLLDSAPDRGFSRLLRCVWRTLHSCEYYLLTRQTVIPTQTDQKVDDSENL